MGKRGRAKRPSPGGPYAGARPVRAAPDRPTAWPHRNPGAPAGRGHAHRRRHRRARDRRGERPSGLPPDGGTGTAGAR